VRRNIVFHPCDVCCPEMYVTMQFCNVRQGRTMLQFDALVHVAIPVNNATTRSKLSQTNQYLTLVPNDSTLLEQINLQLSMQRLPKRSHRLAIDAQPTLQWSALALLHETERDSATVTHLCSGAAAINLAPAGNDTVGRQQPAKHTVTSVTCREYLGNYLFGLVLHCRREVFSHI